MPGDGGRLPPLFRKQSIVSALRAHAHAGLDERGTRQAGEGPACNPWDCWPWLYRRPHKPSVPCQADAVSLRAGRLHRREGPSSPRRVCRPGSCRSTEGAVLLSSPPPPPSQSHPSRECGQAQGCTRFPFLTFPDPDSPRQPSSILLQTNAMVLFVRPPLVSSPGPWAGGRAGRRSLPPRTPSAWVAGTASLCQQPCSGSQQGNPGQVNLPMEMAGTPTDLLKLRTSGQSPSPYGQTERC